MSLILPANLRAPFIAPGRRNRKVHWNAALSKAIRGLGRYEREDWRRGLVFPSGLFGLTRNYLAKKNNPGCGCCGADECENCLGDRPDSYEVTISGYANGTCTTCAAWDGTYVCDSFTASAGSCVWVYDIGGTNCSGFSDLVSVEVRSLSNALLEVWRSTYGSGSFWFGYWQNNYGVKADGFYVDCMNLTAESVAFNSINAGGACTGTPTCTVTTL